MKITENQFQDYRTIILTGQMPDHEVPRFLRDNPEFGDWYRSTDRNGQTCDRHVLAGDRG